MTILPAQPQPIRRETGAKDPADRLQGSAEGVPTSRILSFLWPPLGSPRASHKAKGFACIINLNSQDKPLKGMESFHSP